MFLIFSVHGKNCLGWPQMGPGRFFPANPDLANILGDMDLDFENFHFPIFWIPNFWISRSPEFQISRNLAWARLGPSWAGPGSESTSSPAAPRQPRRTNLRRSKELGQDRENPISASPVSGIYENHIIQLNMHQHGLIFTQERVGLGIIS